MPLTLVRKRTKTHGAFRTVQYRDARGRTFDAVITGAGTGNTVNLRIRDKHRGNVANQTFTNVPLATTTKSTAAYFNRLV